MRTFIALELPDGFCHDVANLAHQLSSVVKGRFMKRQTYHLTLAFLGEVDEAEAQKAIHVLDEVAQACTTPMLNPTGLGKFGKAHDATLFLELQATDELLGLANATRNMLQQEGISFDEKRFRPHITLARRANIPKERMPELAFPRASKAPTVTFFKSTLTPAGAEYKALYSVELR